MKKVNLSKLQPKQYFSEMSQYQYTGKHNSNMLIFKHLSSGDEIQIGSSYVENYFDSADHYEQIIKVGKEDKYWTQNQIDKLSENPDNVRVGDIKERGIRSIFLEIPKGKVFTVIFDTQPKEIGVGAYKSSLLIQRSELIKKFDEQYSRKKEDQLNMLDKLFEEIQLNPISKVESHERTLRGYKLQNHSDSGVYECVDLDIENGYNRRKVTLNNIKALICDNMRYEL